MMFSQYDGGFAGNGGVIDSVTDTPGFVLRQATDAGTIIFSIRPAVHNTVEGTDARIAGWSWVILPPADYAGNGTRKNRPMCWGYNLGRSGGGTPQATAREFDDDATFGYMMEDAYNIAGTNQMVFETYIHSTPANADPANRQTRPFMVAINYPDLAREEDPENSVHIDVGDQNGFEVVIESRDAGTINAGVVALSAGHNIVTGDTVNAKWNGGRSRRTGLSTSVSGNNVTLSGGAGDTLPTGNTAITLYRDVSTAWHDSAIATLDCELDMRGKIGIVFANGHPGLWQKASNGTPTNLIYLSSANYLYIGGSAVAQVQIGNFVRAYGGIGTAYKTSSGTFTDSDIIGDEEDGALGVTNFGGVRKLWFRAGGAWYSVTGS